QFAIQILERKHIIVAILSHIAKPEDVLNDIIHYKSEFISHIGHVSGVIWNKGTDEFCIFRDPFGFVPWMLTYDGRNRMDFSAVTSPEYQAELTVGRGIRRDWIARFLLEQDSMNDDDIYENTGRLLPGEYICHVIGSFDEFVLRLSNDEEILNRDIPDERRIRQIRRCVWHDKKYHVMHEERAELAVALREKIAKAVSRIPDENPMFTLSGGLDSTAIFSSWCANHPGRFQAISLVSGKHRSCDESHELDILENALPVDLTRICMDDFWPLKEPELYGKFRAYGPLVAPGIESLLCAYRIVEKNSGPRMIVTGYGGNFIVKARQEAIFRYLLSASNFRGLVNEIVALDKPHIRYLVLRFLANRADGKIRRIARTVFTRHHPHPDRAHDWMNPVFAAQFPEITVDPVYFMSHVQERASLPLFWGWELRTRCMDMIARLCPHRFYDPLFDTELYDFCACIPPQYFLSCGEYRPIYKEALTPLLPEAIIHHPKCQSYDMLMHDGLSKYARPLLEQVISRGDWADVLDKDKLAKAYRQYCFDAADSEPEYEMNALWLSLSLLLWTHFS
ncbi:MAG: hypothetical protein IJU23_05510, partial [Proteobacteria bacterium]|nr:hypothetical protein [Pseudomonadota bacterium]